MPWTEKTLATARETFLANLARGLSVTGSAAAAGLSRSVVYVWQNEDPKFAAAWLDAIEGGTDTMEDEARRRAVDGVPEPIVTMGKLVRNADGSVMTVQKYSDSLLQFLLKGRRREKFGERVAEAPNGLSVADILTLMEADRTVSHADEAGPATPVL